MEETVFDAFGRPVRPAHVPAFSDKVGDPLVAQFDLEYDPETGSSHPVLKDPLDLQAQIQTFKDQCGMEQAQLLLKRGLASPVDFQAKPGDYGDTSNLPDNINDAYQEALKVGRETAGMDLAQFKTDADIQAYVNQQVELALARQKAQGTPAQGTPKEEINENA